MKFVQQKTESGCTVACIAMVSEKSFEEIHAQVGFKKGYVTSLEEAALLALNDIVAIKQPFSNVLSDSAVYLATVPSLNEVGMNHSVVFVVDSDWRLHLYDPQKGRKGKLYYTCNDPVNDSERFLTSWSDLTRVYHVNDLIELDNIRHTTGDGRVH